MKDYTLLSLTEMSFNQISEKMLPVNVDLCVYSYRSKLNNIARAVREKKKLKIWNILRICINSYLDKAAFPSQPYSDQIWKCQSHILICIIRTSGKTVP